MQHRVKRAIPWNSILCSGFTQYGFIGITNCHKLHGIFMLLNRAKMIPRNPPAANNSYVNLSSGDSNHTASLLLTAPT